MTKRLFDVVVALFGIIILLPVYLLAALLIKLSSPGPVLYRGIRTGYRGRPFRIMKFRTMIANAEHAGGYSTALNDKRLTGIGKRLRKYKLDELPQLFNILIGEMSFVGPRPQVEAYTRLYNEEEKMILSVRPGITDYASMEFIHLDAILGNEFVDEKYLRDIEPKKNQLRLKYVRNQSFIEDLKIILGTFAQMFKINTLWNTED